MLEVSAVALVLCTGINPALQITRKMILEHAGHAVVTVGTEDEIRQACQQKAFDVVVIGQAVSLKYKDQTFEIIRECCASAKILELYTLSTGRTLADADDWLQVPLDVPPHLSDRVTELATRHRS
jgi:hypothetical protein